MNAMPSPLQQQAQQLSDSVTRPIPGSRKVFAEGSRPDLRVAMREVVLELWTEQQTADVSQG